MNTLNCESWDSGLLTINQQHVPAKLIVHVETRICARGGAKRWFYRTSPDLPRIGKTPRFATPRFAKLRVCPNNIADRIACQEFEFDRGKKIETGHTGKITKGSPRYYCPSLTLYDCANIRNCDNENDIIRIRRKLLGKTKHRERKGQIRQYPI